MQDHDFITKNLHDAQLLGLIVMNGDVASLTDLGKQYINAATQDKEKIIQTSILKTKIIRRTLMFIESCNGLVTKKQIRIFLNTITGVSDYSETNGITNRVLDWLNRTSLVSISKNTIRLDIHMDKDFFPLEFSDLNEPLFINHYQDDIYQTLINRIWKDSNDIAEIQSERRDMIHTELIRLLSKQLIQLGRIPRCNQFIDLAVHINGADFIFEAKTVKTQNIVEQINQGVNQLLEYRYIQALPEIKLVLVIGKPLPKDLNWMLDYLETDRQIYLLWDGDSKLHGSDKGRRDLPFLIS